jgi:transposase-like protein
VTKGRRSRNPRGRAPAPDVVAKMTAQGYVLADEFARRLGVARSTVYDWIRLDRLQLPEGADPDETRLTFEHAGNLWILAAARRPAARVT